MNNDGWGQVGAGPSDRRLAGEDLQHYVQNKTHQGGGPMKEHMEHQKHPMHQQLEEEKMRHEHALDHHRHHLEKHHERHYDKQHGHDDYKY